MCFEQFIYIVYNDKKRGVVLSWVSVDPTVAKGKEKIVSGVLSKTLANSKLVLFIVAIVGIVLSTAVERTGPSGL